MEQLLQRIIALLPASLDLSAHADAIRDYIASTDEALAVPAAAPIQLPARMHSIYYLLADHYFKNRDLVKSVKYYQLDLAMRPDRFDAWAGLALSKASVLETKLNACGAAGTDEYLAHCEEALRCFAQCFRLDGGQVPLWIEYGNFAYTVHSFCSRSLKLASETLSMERFAAIEAKKEQCLRIAADCFTTVDAKTSGAEASVASAEASTKAAEKRAVLAQRAEVHGANGADQESGRSAAGEGESAGPSAVAGEGNPAGAAAAAADANGPVAGPGSPAAAPAADESHDEQWLYHYMLGKVAEKRKEPPDAVIAHYVESARCLYEHNASYPFKISHGNPQHLSVEALEVYYRITACVVKYLEHNAVIRRATGRMFARVLREVNGSPFALNQAKIDDQSIYALKRKQQQQQQQQPIVTATPPQPMETNAHDRGDVAATEWFVYSYRHWF